MTALINLEGVSKTFRVPLDRSTTLKYRVTHLRSASRYRVFQALHDITFDVPEGQFLGITGHNGSGKSTLLKILSRIYTADSGSVRVEGRVSPFLELGVGFNPELTARDNIFLNGAVIGLTRAELRRRVDDIIGFAELEDFADQKLKNFSSGMQVRLAFSVAIQAEASILLMDEVLAVGDARFQEKCFDVFARYKREGRTVVLVTHDLGAIETHTDRCLLLDHGSLVADGPPPRVTAHYRRLVSAHSTTPDADDGDERWGSGEVEITSVKLFGAEGECSTLETGEPMRIVVDYRVNQTGGDFVCGIAVRRDDGLTVWWPNSFQAGVSITRDSARATGRIVYDVEELGLLGNTYYLAISLVGLPTNNTLDHRERVLVFRVTDAQQRAGIVAQKGRWTIDGDMSQPAELRSASTRFSAGER